MRLELTSFVLYPPNACVGIDWMFASRVIHLSYIYKRAKLVSDQVCPLPSVECTGLGPGRLLRPNQRGGELFMFRFLSTRVKFGGGGGGRAIEK